ncbi:MAG: hypothetical protein ACXQTW_02295 [Candidatus Methanospirareceae archaeon]
MGIVRSLQIPERIREKFLSEILSMYAEGGAIGEQSIAYARHSESRILSLTRRNRHAITKKT